jgi:hypothetical protein
VNLVPKMGAAAVMGVKRVATCIVALPFQIFSHIASLSLDVARGWAWIVTVTFQFFSHMVQSDEVKWTWGLLCLADGVLFTFALYTLNFRGLVLLEHIEVCVCVCVCVCVFSLSLCVCMCLCVCVYARVRT